MRNNPAPQTQYVLEKLNGVRESGKGWVALCPCRTDDTTPTLSVGEGDSGKVMLHCHRGGGCSFDEICAAINIKPADLMGDVNVKPQKSVLEPQKQQLTLVSTYKYRDESGNLLFEKQRFVDENGKKTFRQRKPAGPGKWTYSLGDVPKVLYNLPEVSKAIKAGAPIWIVEGEKDANTLTEMGIIATTPPNGAGSWTALHTSQLSGAVSIDIIADNDEPGIKHAFDVYEELASAGHDVRVWRTPSSKDITEYLALGGSLDQLVEADSDPSSVDIVEEEVKEQEETEEQRVIRELRELLEKGASSDKALIAKSNLILLSIDSGPIVDPGRLVEWDEFLNESDNDSYEWVIDGLLEKQERVIVVAAEGVGKTMLARQVAILSSCGINPFTYQKMRPIRTLTVDLENPERIIRRTSRPIMAQAFSRGFVQKPLTKLYTRPAGMDLLKAADRILLEEQIEKSKPELLVLGPLYKSFIDPGSRTSESVAIEIAKYLDTIRANYGCALWLEHHAPLGTSMTSRDLRPFGSAVWSRWPEFGISLTPDLMSGSPFVYDVKHFRGARDERNWPIKITRGKIFPFEVLEFSKVS